MEKDKKINIKRLVILLIVVVALVVGIKLFQSLTGDKAVLKKIGYNKDDISVIMDKLSETDLEKILNMDHQIKLVNILGEKYYLSKNLEKYLNYSNNNTDKSTDDIIAIVNVGADKAWYEDLKTTSLSKGISMLVNKFYALPDDYNPDDIVNISIQYAYDNQTIKEEVYNNYIRMWKAANDEGLVLIVNSSFRTLEQQKKEYDIAGDEYAARPGHSEHQTGLAIDIVTYDIIGNQFEETNEFKWLQNNAHNYGFILRFPKGKEYLTGYNYESWHYRYLGADLATKVYESGLTYDEYYAYYLDN